MKRFLKLLGIVALLLLTNAATFFVASGGWVTLPRDRFDQIAALENFVRQNHLYDVTDEQLRIGELKGVVASLGDPYSEYYTKEEFEQLLETTTGKFYGIGVVITKGEDNLITVISPVKGSPAYEAGIRSGDKIIKVNGEDYTADQLEEASDVMKGDRGTTVNVTVLRPQTNDTMDLDIARDEIQMDTVLPGTVDGVSYIGISQFDELTADSFKKALGSVSSDGFILDLRGNPGGVVDTAAEIADMLLGQGIIVYAEGRDGKRDFEFNSDAAQYDKPMVVLIDEGSASASELLAGALKDHDRAKLVGTKSFGKGIVQAARRLPNGDGLKLTTSEYFLPNGETIHKKGIEPDVVVERGAEVKGLGIDYYDEDVQLQKAVELLKEEINAQK
ncbi:S41 family peptidase [Peptoniphilus equinus]|uniref:S41 family peptidase n=1 Tax=Peptoniphilus equinus TaxID=3016343 RepID=A0ABY7QRV7_9FIRM|nr:S41 family peptidase [Peptoniphilus equinus]WBW49509.1 S41 family peptidase [Peptoniphilus equinus]